MTIDQRPTGWTAAAAAEGAWIVADTIFDGKWLRSGQALFVQRGRVQIARLPKDAGQVWRTRGILSPGFVDLQVNGGGGVLLNSRPTAEGARAIARAHRTTGTAAILPTVITDRADVIEAAARAVEQSLGQDGIAGLHIEGPHIALARKGTHRAADIRPLDDRTMALVGALGAARVPVMITVAPEAVAPGQIAALVRQGVVVAIGHTDATAAQVQASLAEGAQTFTHLFNAMSQMQGREPGCVGAAINSHAYCSIICDGLHVAPEMLALAIRARPVADRMVIVTDAMPTVAGPDRFDLYGQTIRLQDGRLVNAAGALAGAHVTMLQSVRFVVERLGQSPELALRMAISHPARLMGFEALGQIEGRAASDVLLIASDLSAADFLLSE